MAAEVPARIPVFKARPPKALANPKAAPLPMGNIVDKALARAPPHCFLLFCRRRRLLMLFSVTYTGRIACYGRTLTVFIGSRDRVSGRDARNATTRGRLLLLAQNLFQLLLHLGLVENTGASPSSTRSRKTRSHRRRQCGVTATSASASASASTSSSTATTSAASSAAPGITGGRRRILTRDASRSFPSSSSSCQRCGVCHCG